MQKNATMGRAPTKNREARYTGAHVRDCNKQLKALISTLQRAIKQRHQSIYSGLEKGKCRKKKKKKKRREKKRKKKKKKGKERE